MAKFDWSKYKVVDPKDIHQAKPFDWSKYPVITPSHSDSGGGFLNTLENLGKGAAQGNFNLLRGAVMGGAHLLNHFLPSNLQISDPKPANVFKNDPQDANTMSAKIGSIIGQSLPFVASPELDVGLLGKGIQGAIEGSGIGAANAENDGHNIFPNAIIGGVLGGGGSLAGNALGSSLGNLAKKATKPGSIMRSPSEAAQYMQAAGDTPVDFGSLINHPGLAKKYNNVLKFSPFSDVADKQQALVGENENRASNILDNLLGNTNEADIHPTLVNSIKDNLEANKANASALYNNVFDQAEKRGIKATDFTNTANAIQSILDKENDPNNLSEKIPQNILSKLQKNLAKYKDSSNYDNEPDSIEDVHNFASDLGEQEFDAKMSDKNHLSSLYSKLKNAVDQDLSKNLENSGASDLLDQYNAAKENYAQNVAPYRTVQLRKQILGKADNKKIVNLLKQSQYSRVLNDLSPEDKNLMAYDLMKGAKVDRPEGGIYTSPQKLQSNFQKIPAAIKKPVLSKQITDQLNNAGMINRLAKYATPAVNTPSTGLLGGENIINSLKDVGLLSLGASDKKFGIPILGTLGYNTALGKLLGSNALKNAYINPATSNLLLASRGLGNLRYPLISALTNTGDNK